MGVTHGGRKRPKEREGRMHGGDKEEGKNGKGVLLIRHTS